MPGQEAAFEAFLRALTLDSQRDHPDGFLGISVLHPAVREASQSHTWDILAR
jgi:hypothetical protein